MKKILINVIKKKKIRIALIDQKKLYNLNIINIHNQKNIYKGIITKIEPSLEAIFVNYGKKRQGFLSFKEIAKEYYKNLKLYIKNILYPGQEILIQINKEEIKNKGAKLTTFIRLIGNFLILIPNNYDLGGISKKIKGIYRIKLIKILYSLKLINRIGLIIRTSGLGKTKKILKFDLFLILKHWKLIIKISKLKTFPFFIYKENNILIYALRDYLYQNIGLIIIDNFNLLDLAKKHIIYFGKYYLTNKIKLYQAEIPLFSYYKIESQIESALQRKIFLPSGGTIIIDNTEALTAIDINSSRSTIGVNIEETALQTNLEAVKEISKQLRLRNLGGLIVIDFIDMILDHHNKKIEKYLQESLFKDKANIKMGPISQFGLLELSRQRLTQSLGEINNNICQNCGGTGNILNKESIFFSIIRLIKEKYLKKETYELHIIVPIMISSYFINEKKEIFNTITKKHIYKIIILPSNKIKIPNFFIFSFNKEKKHNFFFI